MITFPEVQRRAQAELDAVVGRDRLPTFDDAPRLPYVRAIIEEALPWRPSVPLGVAHAATEDDWYESMFIPKGTAIVIAPYLATMRTNSGRSVTWTNTETCYLGLRKQFR
jgi:cytochrome P450